jgi:hypothetical protein
MPHERKGEPEVGTLAPETPDLHLSSCRAISVLQRKRPNLVKNHHLAKSTMTPDRVIYRIRDIFAVLKPGVGI